MFVKVKKYWSKRVEYNMNEYFMKLALDLAKKSFKQNEIPVGCVLVNDKNEIISCASNSMVQNHDPTSHAEIVAIRKACKKLKTTKLLNFSIYTTLEPCLMCESLIISVGIKKIYFGVEDPDKRTFGKSTSILRKKKIMVKIVDYLLQRI